jgi:hypothetical protein
MGEVRSEQRKAKALTWLLDHVQLVDDEGTPVSADELRENVGDSDGGEEVEVSVESQQVQEEAPAGEASS